MVVSLGLGRENPEQRNDEVDAKVRLEVRMRLTAARLATFHRRSRSRPLPDYALVATGAEASKPTGGLAWLAPEGVRR